jgi:methylphosphotriester-DNA--protein-cysteine methyltransferase
MPMKNITLTADESLIEAARAQARADNTTLNAQFRLWLAQYARKQRAQRFRELMDELQPKVSTGGRKFTRDEMNER